MANLYSVAMATELDQKLRRHLLRTDHQEDLCFALWAPSWGTTRTTALLKEVILPEEGDRRVHGNASFSPQYFERAIMMAISQGYGLALIHSHLGSGWQGMSRDDIHAEQSNAQAVLAGTRLPFVGLTLGTDGTWSARFWEKDGNTFSRRWCSTVRVTGEALAVSYADHLMPPPNFRDQLRRTISSWGPTKQSSLARLHVGVVGGGSVGAIIAEALARTGICNISVIDFDHVEKHNLDRLLHATNQDIGIFKADLLEEVLPLHATAEKFHITKVLASVAEEEGFLRALDCDVLFSCVDRPLGRSVLNFIAYAHLIPVVDGGIRVRRTDAGNLLSADWHVHVAAPGRRCLECLGQYDPGLVSLEREGMLDDPTYIDRLPSDHILKANENVFGFSLGCAGLQFLQFIAMVISPMGLSNPGAQTFRFVTGEMDAPDFRGCEPNCPYPTLVAGGEMTGLTVTEPTKARIASKLSLINRWRHLKREIAMFLLRSH